MRTLAVGCTVRETSPMMAPGASASVSEVVAADRRCSVTSKGSEPAAPGQKGGQAMGSVSVRRPSSSSDSIVTADGVASAMAVRSEALREVGGKRMREDGGQTPRDDVTLGHTVAKGGVVNERSEPSAEIHRTVHGTRLSMTRVPGTNCDVTPRW